MGKMKDSGVEWIGEIPEGWEVKRIGTQVYTSQEKAIYTEHFYIGLENIESFTGRYLESEFVPESLGNTFKKGDILFGKLRPYLNKCLIAPKDGLTSSEIFVLNAYNRNNCFFRYLFTSEFFINILSSMTYGAKMPRINWQQFKDILVPIPPISIQQKISAYLNDKCAQIDAILATIRQSIEKLKEYRQAVITQAVTKGLDPDAKMKESGIEWIGEIPEGWSIKRIGSQVCNSQEKAAYSDHFYIGLENIESISGKYIESEFVPDSLGKTFRKGDILFGKLRPYLNKCMIAPKDGLASSEIFVLNAINQNNYFFRYLLINNFFIKILSSMTYGAKMPRINWQQFKDIIVPIPPISIQQEISDYLDQKTAQIDSLIAEKQKLHDKFTAYKKSLIYEYVTGKREVTDDCTE